MLKILERLDKSNSAELRRIKEDIAIQIINANDPQESLENLEEIYLTMNIPNIGKRFIVFQQLHPNFLEEESDRTQDDSIADIPSLRYMSGQERKHSIWSDLLRGALESNDRNLREYLNVIENGNIIYEKLLSGEINEKELSIEERKNVTRYRDILNTLYNMSSKGKREEEPRICGEDLLLDLKELDALFKEDRICKKSLPDRIVTMYGYWAGITSLDQAKKIMNQSRDNAHKRGIELANKGTVVLEDGDFVKGIENTEYLGSMLQRGITAKDYLGKDAKHDCTPLDMDVEKINGSYANMRDALSSLGRASCYIEGSIIGKKMGSIMLVFSGDDFIETRGDMNRIVTINDENIQRLKEQHEKGEVFLNSGSAYGIRTGVGSTKIKYIIVERYIDKVGVEIAKNGFYIPIVNQQGEIVFTPEMYQELRDKMQGLSHYGETTFELDPSAKNNGTKEIVESGIIEKSKANALKKRTMILRQLEDAVSEIGMKMSDERIIDLIPGIVEFIDTGSTGRGTNEPGDGDFDFMVKMDKILRESPNGFKEALRKVLSKLSTPKEKTEIANGDFRYKGVEIEGLKSPVDIDLSFDTRTDEIEYSTDECIKDRLNTIQAQSQEDYKYVIANILLAKKYLKQAGVYKKSSASEPKPGELDTRGGLGAVGIENWVLQNGGSFEKAALTFLEVAKGKSLEEFKKSYAIWDFGENHQALSKNIYAHDNFVYNLTQEGYEKMCLALEKYVEILKEERNESVTEKDKIGIADIVKQDMSVLQDTPYMRAVRSILEKSEIIKDEELTND